MVTGATGGIGKSLVWRLIADDNNVIAATRDPARLSHEAGPGRVMGLRLDMERSETIAAAAAEAAKIAGGGGLSGLVNMAGIIVEGPVEAIPPAELRRQLDINVVGPMALTQALLPLLKRARGRVINIGAISAHITVPFYGPIAASKSALASLNDAMRLEFAQYGVNVILIEPGAMTTGIFATSRAARRHLGGPAGARTPLSRRSCRNGSRL
jgi:NAD(P)-dependent dehydrogenase (short-subunit alcohol dehydrogenase family)